jgi:hypothetical protein
MLRFPERIEFFPLCGVRTKSEIHPASYPVVTWNYFLGTKKWGREADISHPSEAVAKNVWTYTSIPPHISWRCTYLKSQRYQTSLSKIENMLSSVHYIVSKHPVALCSPISGFSLRRLCATPSIYWIHPSRIFVPYCYLFTTTCFGLTGQHQVCKIVDETAALSLRCYILHFTSNVKCL